ncbi:MAG: hypothetical protein P8J59_10610, partial [Phycisphaerales bacterium]|nr:hypothetical protein [Phycisphaerales bacterium]
HSNGDFTPITVLPSTGAGDAPERVIWADIGRGPFHAPFFHEDLASRLEEARWFVSSADVLPGFSFRSPGVPLRGAILHMSRCGSTLARNLLGAVDRSLVMSEASLVNSALAEFTTRSLQPVLSGFLRPDGDRLQRGYLKCTSWNVLAADRLLDSFPGLPLVFIHRNPLEVLVSLSRTPGWGEGFPAGPSSLELETIDSPIERAAIRLRDFIAAARRLEERGACRFVEYPDIISRFIDGDLPEYFGYDPDEATRTRMNRVTEVDSKRPQDRFRSDSAEKLRRAEEIPDLKRAYEKYLHV